MSAASTRRRRAFRGDPASSSDRVEISIYNGRERLGEIVETPGCGVHAQLADGTDLGRFPSRAAASHAVLAASRGG